MTPGLCKHGIPYNQKCVSCIKQALFWKNRNAGGVPRKKGEASATPQNLPHEKTGSPRSLDALQGASESAAAALQRANSLSKVSDPVVADPASQEGQKP